MSSKTISLGTDVAHLVLFHPGDLAHRQDDPIAWYGYDFVYRKESAAGRLLAFCTGADGGYHVRLTTDSLTPQEAAHACKSWTFPLAVGHGRVLLDNTDALPGQEQMTGPNTATDCWYDIANGLYRATVHPIDRTDEEARALPDYVITFEPVETLAGIAVANTPPDLRPFRDWEPGVAPSMGTEQAYAWPKKTPDGAAFPTLVVDERAALLPGQSVKLGVPEEVSSAAFPDRRERGQRTEHFIAAPQFAEGGLAALVWAHGRATAVLCSVSDANVSSG